MKVYRNRDSRKATMTSVFLPLTFTPPSPALQLRKRKVWRADSYSKHASFTIFQVASTQKQIKMSGSKYHVL